MSLLKRSLYISLSMILLMLIGGVSIVSAYDQVFPSVKLRYGYGYKFTDTFYNATNTKVGLDRLQVTFREEADFNGTSNPTFPWTQEIRDKGFILQAGQSSLITRSTPVYAVKYHPVTRKKNNIEIIYKTTNFEWRGGKWTNKTIHTEYQPYEITWCGDGIVDNYTDPSGLPIHETCDPMDANKTGWGTGGCNTTTCEPIDIPTPPTCSSINVNPISGNAPLVSNLSCTGENATSYKIDILKGGVLVDTIASNIGTYIFNTEGNYTASCFVNGTITTPSCTQNIIVTPPVSACTNLTASPTTARNSLTSTLTCTGSGATNYKIDIRDSAGNIVNTIAAAQGNVTLNTQGTYTASCYVNGETTTPVACQQTLSVTGGGGGTDPHCTDVFQDNPDTLRCYGNFKVKSFYATCGNDPDTGNPIILGVKNAIQEGNRSRRYADFTCSSPQAQCFAYSSTIPTSDSRWDTGTQCRLDAPKICGNGIIDPGEQCDFGLASNWGKCVKPGNTGQCTLPGGPNPDPKCTDNDNCVLTTPNGGQLIFGPSGDTVIGHNKNPLNTSGSPYLFNNSDYDFSFNKFCIKRTSGTAVLKSTAANGEYCADIERDMIYAYERIQLSDYGIFPNYTGDKSGIPSNSSYGTAVLTTSIKDDIDNNGTIEELYDSYLSSKLNIRVAKPVIATIGGGTSYIKNSSVTGDVEKITDNLNNYSNNKNFVGTSANTSGISSYAAEVTNSSAIGVIKQANTDYTNIVNAITDTTSITLTTVTGFSDKYNGLENVYIVSGKNVVISSIPSLTKATTFIVEGGNLTISGDLISSQNVAFVVKGGNIIIKDNVSLIKGTYIAIPVGGVGGKIMGEETDTQLRVKGSLYGDTTDLVDNRYYISEKNGQLSVGTIVSFGSSLFRKPAPLVGQFIGEYLASSKVAK